MLRTIIIAVIVAVATLLHGTTVLAGDGDAGREKAKALYCVGCHGQEGLSTLPKWPNLAGQKEQYLITALQGYRSRERAGSENAATMWPLAQGLSDEDIEDLAAYYANQDWRTSADQ